MSVLNDLFGRFPSLEVATRVVYKRLQSNKYVEKLSQKYRGDKPQKNKEHNKLWEDYKRRIEELPIDNGDILIVHSSLDGLEDFNIKKEEIIDFLRGLVGDSGTLVMPAFPFYRENHVVIQFNEQEEPVKKYNPRLTPAWTGLLPNYLCTIKGAIRSLFPYNSIVAIGGEAEAMTRDNLKGQAPHGRYSAWEYCMRRHAKVLFLGVSPVHSTTEIHLTEDLMFDNWPIKGWYKKQEYKLKIEKNGQDFSCLERKKFWSQFVTEQYCFRQLVINNILKYEKIDDVPLGYIDDLSTMTNFVMERVKKDRDLLFYRIPNKYWKKK